MIKRFYLRRQKTVGASRSALTKRRARIAIWLFLLLSGIAGSIHSQSQQGETASTAYVVHIDGVINPGATGLLQHAIDTATAAHAAALIVRIDTPGGLLSSTRDMVSAIAESPVPVIGYVGPTGASATSAGAFILLATHIAAMNTGTNVGASSPVAGDGAEIEGTMGKKVMNDSRAFMRSIANSRGRNADVAERFVSEAESVTATEALASNIIDVVVRDFSELLQAVDGREIQFQGEAVTLSLDQADLRQVEPRLIDRVLKYIAHPQIAHMLISLGVLAIYIEILSPGLAFPGVLGAISVVLGLVGIQTLPVNVGFLVLLFLGLGLMISEYFVAGFGVLGIGGAVAFVLGSLNLFDAPITADYQSAVLSISIAVCAAILLTSFLVTRSVVFGSRKQKKVVGQIGEAMVSFTESGYVLVDEQRWPADTQEPVNYGDLIVVISQGENGRLLIKKVTPQDSPT